MTEYYDALETRDPVEREQALLAALPAHIAHAQMRAPGFSRILAGIDAQAVTSRAALARLPVTRKSDLAHLQKEEPPLGGLNATPLGKPDHQGARHVCGAETGGRDPAAPPGRLESAPDSRRRTGQGQHDA